MADEAQTDDIGALLESVKEPEVAAPAPQEAPAKPQEFYVELKRNNEITKFNAADPVEQKRLVDLAQKGLDYDLNNRLLRQEREIWEAKKKEYETLGDPKRLKELDEYDKYTEKYPKFKEVLQKTWNDYLAQNQGTETTNQNQPPLWDTINKLAQEVNELKTDKQKSIERQQDQELEKQITELKGKFKDYPWDQVDADGFNGEAKLLRHMSSGGFYSAKAALMDLYGEQMIEKTRMSAKEEAAKEIQERYNKGFVLNKKLTRPNVIEPKATMKNTSYDDLAKLAIKEVLGG